MQLHDSKKEWPSLLTIFLHAPPLSPFYMMQPHTGAEHFGNVVLRLLLNVRITYWKCLITVIYSYI
jgi:hypothetical protein